MTIAVRAPGCLIKELDLTKEEFLDLVRLAAELKREKRLGTEGRRLTGRNIALIFEKASTRTRCAFEVAAYDQGAHVTYIGTDGSHLGHKESVRDTARVLGRLYDGIEYRGFDQSVVEDLAEFAGVPVWNGLTDQWHPTQMLADVLTMLEHRPGRIEEISCCYLGDGRNNVARSLLVTGALLGMDVRIAAPATLQPPADVVAAARAAAAGSGARILVTDDVDAAVRGADFLYTDVWVSMGEPDEVWDARVPQLLPYRITTDLLAATGTPTTKVLHCLPALHDAETSVGRRLRDRYGLVGAEIADDVFASDRTIVLDQAENRMHTIKAVLVTALER
ncbi:ornithine carbamoyltransferase [Cryptosporangium minutisporangium]|uniref:Ornithine carbamoyltransferase n=1 Tax=Cryptosporangium minutisporangium TaxID=113569 RepID=A0ABP6T9C2_9ACTN